MRRPGQRHHAEQAARHERRAQADGAGADSPGHARGRQRPGDEAEAEGQEHQPCRQRAEAETLLEEDGQTHEERRQAGKEGHCHHQAQGKRRVPEQPQVDQGRAPGAQQEPLVQHERGQRRPGGGERQHGPGRPSERLPLHQRVGQQTQRQGHEHDAAGVERGPSLRAGGTERRAREGQGDCAHGHVDEEDRPPAQPGDVRLHQRAADQLGGDGGQAHRGAEIADRPPPFVLVEGHADDGQHLRTHHRRRQPLQHPRRDQHGRGGSQAAQGGGRGEAGHADHEQPLAAVQVAQPSAGDQQHREGEAVPGHHHLQVLRPCAQLGVHGGQGDVDDEKVERRQEAARQQHDQSDPALRVQADGSA